MLRFMAGDNELAKRMQSHPWHDTDLGDPVEWPEALKTLVSVMLGANQPMFIVWGPNQTLLYNDQYSSVLKGHHPEALGRPFLDVWREIVDDLRPLVEGAYAGIPSHTDDIMLMMERNGYPEETHFAFSYTPVRLESGDVAGFLCACVETTQQVLLDRALRDSESHNRQILDSAIDYAIIATDIDGLVTRWNAGAERILGWTEAEMRGQPVDRFFTPEDRAIGRPQTEMRLALECGAGNDERWHQRKSGERFWANGELTPLKNDDGSIAGFVKVLRDRTDQRIADETLRASEALARENVERVQLALTAGAIIGTWSWDLPTDQFRVDDAFARAFGLDPLLGRTGIPLEQIVATVHPDDQEGLATAINEAIQRGGAYAHQYRVRRADGRYYWIEANGRVEHSADGVPINFPGVILDVEARRTVEAERDRAAAELRALNETLEQRVAARTAELMQAEDQLRQSQKVEAIGQLTGGVAHDFNNLLTVIRGSVDLLRRPDVPEERRIRYIDSIADTADRATKLTGQLLAFARRQSLKPEVFDAGESVRAISDMVQTLTGSRIKVGVRIQDWPCYIDADRSQFDTAIVNMAVNARDAMSGEGELTITVSTVSGMPAIRSHPFTPGEFVTISLTDTGAGIPVDKLDHIFEPFFTTKGIGEGTGLGLSQVFGFTKQSGGDIFAESSEGEGATFTMYLPRVEGDANVAAKTDETALPLGEGACILVVEDNAEVGMFATQALAELGYNTVLAMDGAKALAELATCGDRIDVVFSDVMMPGMSGIELGQEIGRRYPALPVILTSGYSEVLAQNGTHGFELLHKPYSIDALSRILRKVSRRR
jgi:PAS domain S-box-containing protein